MVSLGKDIFEVLFPSALLDPVKKKVPIFGLGNGTICELCWET